MSDNQKPQTQPPIPISEEPLPESEKPDLTPPRRDRPCEDPYYPCYPKDPPPRDPFELKGENRIVMPTERGVSYRLVEKYDFPELLGQPPNLEG